MKVLDRLRRRRHPALRSVSRPGSASDPPRGLAWRSSTTFIVATVCLAIFTDIFLYGLVVPVLPYSLTAQVGLADDELQRWNAILLACYSGALFLLSPVVGMYADRTSSRRLPLLLGLLALAGSTVLLCIGRSLAVFIVGRIFQGLSAAIVWCVGLALLADTMGRNIGLSMGYVNIAMTFGLLGSPLIGGAVYAGAGYYAVFYIAFAIILCDVVLRLLLIEKKIAKQWITQDHIQERGPAVAVAEAVGPLGQPLAGQDGRVDAEVKDEATNGDVMAAAAAAASSAPAEGSATIAGTASSQRAKNPHIVLLKSRRMLAALVANVIVSGLMFAMDTVVPLFVKDTFHWSSTAAGLVFFCIFIPGFISPWVGMLADRYGAKWPALLGFSVSLPLLVSLRFVTDDTVQHKVLFGALLALLGAMTTFSTVPLMAEISFAIEAKEAKKPGIWGEQGVYGIGFGLFNTAFAAGGTGGSLLAGNINASYGWSTMTWSLAIWCGIGMLVVALWVGGPHPKKVDEPQQHPQQQPQSSTTDLEVGDRAADAAALGEGKCA